MGFTRSEWLQSAMTYQILSFIPAGLSNLSRMDSHNYCMKQVLLPTVSVGFNLKNSTFVQILVATDFVGPYVYDPEFGCLFCSKKGPVIRFRPGCPLEMCYNLTLSPASKVSVP